MNVKSIFFDLDNTIWDFTSSAQLALKLVYQQYLQPLGVNEESWIATYGKHNNELWRQYRMGQVTSDEVKKLRFTRAFEELIVPTAAVDSIAISFLQNIVANTVLFPGVIATLGALSQTYTLGVITNGFATSTTRLAALGLDKVFSCVITSEAIGIPKPRPEIFVHAAATVGLRPEDLAYVGDDYDTDIVGANGAGLKTILFNHKHEALETKALQPDAVIYEFAELMALFPAG